MNVTDILKLAASQIGVFESPPNSNNVKYNTMYYGGKVNNPSLAWCCTFVWWLFKESGGPALFYGGSKTASCTTLMNYHASKGQVVYKDFKPGDLALFNWKGEKHIAQHIGVIESVKKGAVVTIEGNTSTGNDTNGGTVMRRERNMALIICAIRPAYSIDPVEEYKQIIQSKVGFSDPGGVWSLTDKSPYAKDLYRKWAESYK